MSKIASLYPVLLIMVLIGSFMIAIDKKIDDYKCMKKNSEKAEQILKINNQLLSLTIYASELYIDTLSDNVYELGNVSKYVPANLFDVSLRQLIKNNNIKDDLIIDAKKLFEKFNNIKKASNDQKKFEKIHSSFLSAMSLIEQINSSINHAFFKINSSVDHRTYFYYQKIMSLIYYISLERSIISGFMFVQNHNINNNELEFINKHIENLWQEISGYDDIVMDNTFKSYLNEFHEEYMNKYIKTKRQVLGVKNDINFSFDLEMFIKQSNKVISSLFNMSNKLHNKIQGHIDNQKTNKKSTLLLISFGLIVSTMILIVIMYITMNKNIKTIKKNPQSLLHKQIIIQIQKITEQITNIRNIPLNTEKHSIIEQYDSDFIKTKLDLLKMNLKHEYNSGNININLFEHLNREIEKIISKIIYNGNSQIEISNTILDTELVNFYLDCIDNIITETITKLNTYERR